MKSTSVPAQAGIGPAPRGKAGAKAAKKDDTLEFDFGLKPSAPVTPVTSPISTPAEPVAEKKETPAIFSEAKLRIHHTTTPDPSAGPSKPLPPMAAALHTKSKFSIDSIKITDLTGELDEEKKDAAIPMPAPSTSTKPVTPISETTSPVASVSTPSPAPVKSEPVVEKKPIAPTTPTAAAPIKTTPVSAGMPASITSAKSEPVVTTTPVSVPTTPKASEPVHSVSKPVKTTLTPASVTTTSIHSTSSARASSRLASTPPVTTLTSTPAPTPAATTPSSAIHLPKETTPNPSTRNSTMALNQPSVSDFRKNAERQAKEQHAVGSVLTWVGYSLVGGFILFVALAAFGGYTLKQMIDSQSVSIAQLDAKYNEQLTKHQTDLEQLRSDMGKLSDQLAATANLMAKQQEQLKRTAASADDSSAVLKARTRELNELRDRVRRLEGGRISR